MTPTIFALSSGQPPAGIAVIRISGAHAGAALAALAGTLPPARRATAAVLRNVGGEELDRALVLWLPGPGTATGEDVAELHLHGGRAVVSAVLAVLAELPGLRAAEAGEFTRRAFANGRIDLAEAEGLAALLEAETELQRRAALALAGGALSRQVEDWRVRVLSLSAEVEAALDFGDEDDVAANLPAGLSDRAAVLSADIGEWLSRPRAEPLREGYRVALAGPPNAGKSTLFNALIGDEAAITSPQAGTTRDVLERPVAIDGVPLTFMDTAGLRGETGDSIEREGIARAERAMERADLVLWLGPPDAGPAGSWPIAAKSDLEPVPPADGTWAVSALTGAGLAALKRAIVAHARAALPRPGEAALNRRQHALLASAHEALAGITTGGDPLLVAERLRSARAAFDQITGRAATEDMLDALFGRFCIGK